MSLFKLIRIVILLSILFVMVVGAWLAEGRLARWERPIWITVYPVMASGDAETEDYAARLDASAFQEINAFLDRELALYGVQLTPPVHFQIAPVSHEIPPTLPDQNEPARIAIWSLKMRWWAWRRQHQDGLIDSDIQMFVLYHKVGGHSEINMSVGMRKGMYGVVKAYAGRQHESRNQVVIAHELLHVLGATDKYVLSTGNPEYPFGYAEPDKKPLFPQTLAEIMGGRIPLSAFDAVMPDSLRDCRIGQQTAEEIGLFDQLVD
ncbi:hypothetical protein [Elongatibacter sediminis]|uniref:Peptidase M10 metallopeptidase domain-containing protein n=1 Tax=Elongatibacter sediminis TaxID=3119006 RepID=A0AAW9REC0_9GAMM